jgi:hypothetical protein
MWFQREYIFFKLANQKQELQRRTFFLKINQSEAKIACSGEVCQRIGTK